MYNDIWNPPGVKVIEAFVSQKPDKIWKNPGPGFNSFFTPIDLAVNSKGIIYVLEWSRHRVLKLAPTGSLLKQWGNQGASEGEFLYPTAIAIDKNDFVYIAYNKNHRIQKFDSEGNYILTWGKYGSGFQELISPNDLVIGEDNSIYVVDKGNRRIQKFDSNSTFLMTVQNPFGEEPIYTKGCITFDQSGKLITSLMGKNLLQRYSTERKLIDDWSPILKGGFKISTSDKIVTDSEGFLYIVNHSEHMIYIFPPNNWKEGVAWNANLKETLHSWWPSSIVFRNKKIYVADKFNDRLFVFTRDKLITAVKTLLVELMALKSAKYAQQ